MKNEQNTALRFGHVRDFNAKKHMATVHFPDLGITSGWLPVLIPNSNSDHDERPLSIGEHVACLLAGTGKAHGVILGAFYDAKNKPPVADENVHAVTFSDGTQITYDTHTHTLNVESSLNITIEGVNVNISAESITLSGGHIDLDGSVTCPGYCRC